MLYRVKLIEAKIGLSLAIGHEVAIDFKSLDFYIPRRDLIKIFVKYFDKKSNFQQIANNFLNHKIDIA